MELSSKQDYINVLAAIIEPLREELRCSEGAPCFGSTRAWYNDISTTVETFARPLWGLVPLWKGGNGDDELKEIYRKGIINGTNPTSEQYWGKTGSCDQRYVEMASMAYAILFTPEVVWNPLSIEEKNNFKNWLWQINDNDVCDSNWRFFRVLVNVALKHIGEDYSQKRLDEDLARFEDFYIGNGWYMDGSQQQKDYYISMAIHFYSLIYSCFEDDKYASLYRERAVLFGRDFIYWFADNGSALPYGRSLTYRFAQGAFWSACLLAKVNPFETSIIKGIISRHISDWMNAPIFDNGGVLTIGYKYQNLLMAEHYNSPGSPYWGLKFFAMLALDDDNDFWSASCAELPNIEERHLMREADMLVMRADGEVYAYPAGTQNNMHSGKIPSKYLKFVYSTKFGFNVNRSGLSIEESGADNMLVFNIGGVFCERRFNNSFELSENKIIINWSPIRGIRVKTEIIPNGASHIRNHIVVSEFECIAYDCGYAISDLDMDNQRGGCVGNKAWSENDFSRCEVYGENGCGTVFGTAVNTNIIYPKTVLPAVKYHIKKGTNTFSTTIEAK